MEQTIKDMMLASFIAAMTTAQDNAVPFDDFKIWTRHALMTVLIANFELGVGESCETDAEKWRRFSFQLDEFATDITVLFENILKMDAANSDSLAVKRVMALIK